MSQQSFGQTLACITAAGQAYNTFTTAKSMLGAATATAASAGVIKIPAGFFQLGTMLEIDFHVGVSSASGQTWTIQTMLGPTSNIIAFTSGVLKVSTTTGTNEQWIGKIWLTCRSIGSGTLATLQGGGWIEGRTVCPIGATPGANYTAGMGVASLVEAAPAVGTGFDSTVDNVLDFFVASGTSAAGNQWTTQQYKVFSPNVAGF